MYRSNKGQAEKVEPEGKIERGSKTRDYKIID